MKVRVALMAPGVEPVQGISRNWIPLDLSFSPMVRLAAGEMVLASAAMASDLAPAMTPSGPVKTCSDMRVSPTQAKTMSDCSATSFGVVHAVAFSSEASCFALLAVYDQTATW